MRKFIIISKRVSGWVEYYFTKAGILCGYVVKGELPAEQLYKLAEVLPATLEGLRHMAQTTGAELREVQEDYSYDRWYDLFSVPRNRERALGHWKKLTADERAKCFVALEAYDRYCQRNPWYNRQYPDSWLSQKQFNAEWDKL